MEPASINNPTIADSHGSSNFWSIDYSCRKCGAEIQCHHSDRYPGGREFFELSTGRVHRCQLIGKSNRRSR